MVNRTKKVDPDLPYMKEDKTLTKVEKYVDKNREETSKDMTERKSKRPPTKIQSGDLEVMISRISETSKPKHKVKKTSRILVWIIYAIIIFSLLMLCVKILFR